MKLAKDSPGSPGITMCKDLFLGGKYFRKKLWFLSVMKVMKSLLQACCNWKNFLKKCCLLYLSASDYYFAIGQASMGAVNIYHPCT